MDFCQTRKTTESFTIIELKKTVRYKQGKGNRDKISSNQDEVLTIYQDFYNLPPSTVSDDEDMGHNDV